MMEIASQMVWKISECLCMVQDLIVASAAGDTSVVQQLLDSGADPNYITSDGKETALVVAAANNHGDVIQLLLQGGASVHLKVDGFCPLAFAILMDSVEAVRALVAGGADPNEDMHTAAAYSSGPVLLALIQGGGDVNLVSSKGITVLVIAAYYGNQEAIEVLVENGADKAKTGGVGVLPRDVLCKCTVASEISHTCQADKCESPQKMISLLTPID